MSKAIEVITSVERRRRWGAAEKERLVSASLEPDASVSAVAREAGIHPGQLYGWRRQLLRRPQSAASFATVRIAAEAAPADLPGGGLIEVEFANESRMRITGAIDPATLTTAIATLACAGGGDDHTAYWGAGVAGDRPHRHAQGFRWVGTAGAGDAQAQSARWPFVRVPRRRGALIKVLWHDGQG